MSSICSRLPSASPMCVTARDSLLVTFAQGTVAGSAASIPAHVAQGSHVSGLPADTGTAADPRGWRHGCDRHVRLRTLAAWSRRGDNPWTNSTACHTVHQEVTSPSAKNALWRFSWACTPRRCPENSARTQDMIGTESFSVEECGGGPPPTTFLLRLPPVSHSDDLGQHAHPCGSGFLPRTF